MAKNRDNIRIYGDDDSAVYVAAKGSTLPTSLTAPGEDFTELGWLSEDGIDFDRDLSVTTFNGWQGGGVVRTKKTSVVDTFHVICLEETAVTMGLYYAGQEATTTGGVDHITVTNQTKSDPRAWVVDNFDGDIQKRYVVPSGEVTAVATIPHNNGAITVLDLTVTINGDYDIYKTAAA